MLRLKRKNKKENQDNINELREYGLDGISRCIIENKYIYNGLQMKLWNNTLCANDLGTFMSVVFNRFDESSKGYLYHTSKLEKTLKDDLNKKNKIISIKIDNPYVIDETKNEDIILRYYQKEAINKLNDDWKGIKSIILPCGTGKTIIFSEHLKSKDYKNIFILSPLKILTEQNLERIKPYLDNYNFKLIDSDGTRDINEIINYLDKKTLFSSTFKSAEEVLIKIFENKNIIIDLSNTILIVDEAHNILNRFELQKFIKKFDKVLLVTATPPKQMNDIICCIILYEYSFKKAIEDKNIVDYTIYLPYIENTCNDKPIELNHLDNELCNKGLFILNGLLKKGCRRCIIYLKNKSELKIYQYILEEIMEKYHYCNIIINNIIDETDKIKRKEILEDFNKYEDLNIIKIILSIRILDEGIDIPICDSIFITHLGDQYNDLRIIQRISRAMRVNKFDKNKKAHIFIWSDDINKSLKPLRLLKENDIEFYKKIKYNSNKYYNNADNNTKILNKNYFIDFLNIECFSDEEIWNIKKDLLFEFTIIKKRCIINHETYKNIKLGEWYKHQKNEIIKIDNDNITSSKNYIELSKNEFIKIDLDKQINKLIKRKMTELKLKEKINELNLKERINKLIEEEKKTNASYYNCERCLYKTEKYTNIIRHVTKKFLCNKIQESYKYSDDQIFILSILPKNEKNENNLTIKNEDLKKYENSDILHKNKNDLLNIIKDVNKNGSKNCIFCNKKFIKTDDVKRHIIIDCFVKYFNKDDNDDKNKINYLMNNLHKEKNLNTSNFISKSINNNLKNIEIISFDREWDLSQISLESSIKIMFSIFMYTALLEEIFKNKLNINIIFTPLKI